MMADPLAQYDPIFQAAGDEWNVDPLLLKSIAYPESHGNPKAVSPAGAKGLMQIMDSTAKQLGVTNVFDPVENIFAGAKYMSEALDAEKTPEEALLYYHGGPDWRAPDKFGPESRNYVPLVAARYQQLLKQKAIAQPTAVASATQPPQEQP
jgi:soluble lytic murein transglycosylase-like protein